MARVISNSQHLEVVSQPGESEEHADGVDDGVGIDQEPFVSNGEASVVAGVGKCPLDSPTIAVAAHPSTVVGASLRSPIPSMRCQQADADRRRDRSQRVAVVGLVGDDDLWPKVRTADPSQAQQHRFDELGLANRSRRAHRGERHTLSTHEEFGFGALPALREADSVAPSFAARKVASMYVSCRSSRPRASRTPSSASHAPRQTRLFSQSRRRRQQVTPLGNGGGRSRQRAPDRSTQMIPSTHSRLPRHGRPPLSFPLRFFGSGNSGCSTAHCSSVRIRGSRLAISQTKPQLGKKYKYHIRHEL